jgi:hypothetical protein
MRFCLIAIIALCFQTANAQIKEAFDSIYYQAVSDSVQRYMDKHPNRFKPEQNKLKITPFTAINYTQEDGFGIILGISGQYRNGLKTSAPLSNISALGYISTKGSIKIGISGINYTKIGKSRFEYRATAFYDDRYFWGIGYSNGSNSSNRSFFTEAGIKIDTYYRFLLSPIFNIAPNLGFIYYNASNFTYPHLAENLTTDYCGFHLGADIVLDTRDNSISPKKGVMLNLNQKIFPRVFFNSEPFYKTAITADLFFKGWKGAVFALDLFSESNYGNSPWFIWTPIGGDTRMRGYYYGRYRDKNTLSAQLEWRQNIYKWHGMVLWGGAANIFPSYREIDLKKTLPNYGIGYRLEMGSLLFKLDAGFGQKGEWSIIAGFNHAF